jgi:lipase (class 3)
MASSPALVPSIPDNVAAARRQVMTSDFFALCYLMLANLAYASENSAGAAVKQIIAKLPTLPVPQAQVAGQWRLAWGPCVKEIDNSNLMYAAEFLDSVSGLPVFSAIVIRGTDTQAEPAGILVQLIEDIDAAEEEAFPPDNSAGAKIAQGTKIGLGVLTGFKDSSGRTVEQYATDFSKQNHGAPIVVTGHSLGGCQTTVVALDLAIKIPGATIVPNSFAAPTAGNPAFIQLYEQTFPFCPRWFNTLDLVPMAFAGLGDIKDLWDQCNRPGPRAFKLIIDGFELLLKTKGIHYAQQSAGASRALAGACQPPAAPGPGKVSLDQVVIDIEASLRRVAAKAHLPVPEVMLHGLVDWVKELLFQHLVLTGYWNSVAASPGVAPIPNPFEQAEAAKA